MKKIVIMILCIIFVMTSIIIAATCKGTVIGVKNGKVLVEVGKDANKFKKGDKVEIKINKKSGEAFVPNLQGC